MMLFQFYLSHWIRPRYVWKKVMILLLCIIHTFTREHVFRSVRDLFVWEDGLCADMVVVILFFIFCILSIADDISILYDFMTAELEKMK